jgi:Leucine-rich repeat (LRR) protein
VTHMEHFHAGNNRLEGPLIEFSRSMPRIFTINLSNQKHNEGGGLVGSLSKDIPSLLDLLELKLSGNTLTNTIPADIGDIPSLRLLNLSNNDLSGEIPSKLGQLAGECQQCLVDFIPNLL